MPKAMMTVTPWNRRKLKRLEHAIDHGATRCPCGNRLILMWDEDRNVINHICNSCQIFIEYPCVVDYAND